MFRATESTSRCRVSTRCQPMWGVRRQFFCARRQSLDPSAGGSLSWTSRPAPAMTSCSRASHSSSSLMMPPLAVLMRKAPVFIFSKWGLPIDLRVSEFSGQCTLTKSDRPSSSSMLTTSAPSHGLLLREVITTFMPKTRAISDTFDPMAPLPPMSPIVFPASSKWLRPRMDAHPSLSGWGPHSLRCCCAREQLRLRTKVITMDATAPVEYTGTLQTAMPLFLAASPSMLL
mmetsp:Transcript_5725/g.14247  ORF Transcript_5725/g.14247 Transcript_5725/m.14247 type:complete len:230 (+) Transcript_5725:585-1274(+)